ncbi:hypothetical protein D3C76_1656410 [compost metagenome]
MELILAHFFIMKFVIKFPVGKIISNVLPAAISAVAMGVLGIMLQRISDGVIWSVVSIFICGLFYSTVLVLFPSMRQELKGINKMLKGKQARY